MRSLERLLVAGRLEAEPSLAPLGVRAVCNFAKLLLRYPELMPSVVAEDGTEVAQEADAGQGPGDLDAMESEHEDSASANDDGAQRHKPLTMPAALFRRRLRSVARIQSRWWRRESFEKQTTSLLLTKTKGWMTRSPLTRRRRSTKMKLVGTS
jgi:hypothetical protein